MSWFPKAGTSTFYNLLSQHPKVYQGLKEFHAFDEDKNYERLPAFFIEEAQEKPTEEIFADFMPDTLAYNFARERMFATLGTSIKAVILLRHPVNGAFSQFNHHRSDKVDDTSPFAEAIRDEVPSGRMDQRKT